MGYAVVHFSSDRTSGSETDLFDEEHMRSPSDVFGTEGQLSPLMLSVKFIRLGVFKSGPLVDSVVANEAEWVLAVVFCSVLGSEVIKADRLVHPVVIVAFLPFAKQSVSAQLHVCEGMTLLA